MAKKTYKKTSNPKLPIRTPELLVKDRVETDDGQVFVPWDLVAPGLYPDEEVLQLSNGEKVAVSVEPDWLDHNAGIVLHGFARWIDETGATQTFNDKPIETSYSASFDHGWVEKHGVNKLAAEVVKILLGEELTTVAAEVTKDIEPDPAHEVADPAQDRVKLIAAPTDHLQSADIHVAIAHIKRLEKLRVKL